MNRLHIALGAALAVLATAGAYGIVTRSPSVPPGPAVLLTASELRNPSIDNYEAPRRAGPIIRAIGIYEGGSRHDFNHSPQETVNVRVEDQDGQALYLALSSYEPVLWRFSGPGVAAIRGVYLDGYNRQEARGISSAVIVDKSGLTERNEDGEPVEWVEDGKWDPRPATRHVGCALTYAKPDGGGCDSATDFLANARGLFNVPVASFLGTYNAQGFRIGARNKSADEAAGLSAPPSSRSHSNPWSIDRDR